MATRRDGTRTIKKRARAATRTGKPVSSERYPHWKVQLFRAGIAERRNAAAAQITGRAMRAPGA